MGREGMHGNECGPLPSRWVAVRRAVVMDRGGYHESCLHGGLDPTPIVCMEDDACMASFSGQVQPTASSPSGIHPI